MTGTTRDKLLIFGFSCLTIVGVACGLLYALNLDLNSDTVVPGLAAREIFSHGNFQYNFPIYDSYLFTDIYTFHLIPQAISGYDANVLRLTAFGVFLLVILTFSYLIYRYTDIIKALIFAALATNLGAGALTYFISPEFHVGTLLATGILLFLCDPLRIQKMDKKVWLAIIFCAGLIAFSDAILFAFFIIPYALYYFFFARKRQPDQSDKNSKTRLKNERIQKEKNRKTDFFVAALLLVSIVMTVYKFIQPGFLNEIAPAYVAHASYDSAIISGPAGIISHLQQYLLSLSLLVNANIHNLLARSYTPLDLIAGIVFLAVIAYALTRTSKIPDYLKLIMGISAIVVFISFLATTFADESAEINARFLIFTAIAVFAFIAMAYDNKSDRKNTLFVAAIAGLIIVTAAVNVSGIKNLDFKPNDEQYRLIDYLKQNNVTYGISGYSDSNLITYLSKESVPLREVTFEFKYGNKDVFINDWLVPSRYTPEAIAKFSGKTDDTRYVIVTNTRDPFYSDINKTFQVIPPAHIDYYENYVIGYYNKSL